MNPVWPMSSRLSAIGHGFFGFATAHLVADSGLPVLPCLVVFTALILLSVKYQASTPEHNE